jgi:hypothetical protein
MKKKNASCLITLIHCLSETNANYDLKFLPNSYMKRILPEYIDYVRHMKQYRDSMPEVLTSKGEALEMIRRRLVVLKLLDEQQENNEHA